MRVGGAMLEKPPSERKSAQDLPNIKNATRRETFMSSRVLRQIVKARTNRRSGPRYQGGRIYRSTNPCGRAINSVQGEEKEAERGLRDSLAVVNTRAQRFNCLNFMRDLI